MAVILNPTIRKFVGIVIPIPRVGYIAVGFGVCPDTSDPKLVKISVDKISSMWVVEVFALSTRVWKTVYMDAPFKSCEFTWLQVFVDGVIYFLAYDDVSLDHRSRFNFVISFDLKSEKFGEVCLPERLVHAPYLDVAKVNESLGLIEYYVEGDMAVCGVWTRKHGAKKTFSKMYTDKVEGKSFNKVLGFRNNEENVIKVLDDENHEEYKIEVYEPLSGFINGVGINGERRTFYARSYMETLLLLDQSDSIIQDESKKVKRNKKTGEKEIKWKKIIVAALKSADGRLKIRNLRNKVLRTVKKSGSTIDQDQLASIFDHKVNSSSRFSVNGKHVELIAKS